MKNAQDCSQTATEKKEQLELTLAKTQLRLLVLELMIDIAEKHYNIDIKKDCGGKQLKFYGNQSLRWLILARSE